MMIWSIHLGEDSPFYSTVKKWVADFKQDRESTDDDAWTGRSNSGTTDAVSNQFILLLHKSLG